MNKFNELVESVLTENEQDKSIAKLKKKGFRLGNMLDNGDIMMRKKDGPSTQLCQVGTDGTCNGLSFDDYVKQYL